MTEHLTRSELIAAGFTGRGLTAAVRSGRLIRARRDHYLTPDVPEPMVRAVRVGGRLTCLSLLAMLGVFVLSNDKLHVHVAVNAARLRSPHDRRRRLQSRSRRGVRLHWHPLSEHPGQSTAVGIIDALADAVRCQMPRAAVATLDSAIRQGVIARWQLQDVFDLLPARYAVIARLVDPRAESGPESLVRLMLRGLGRAAEPQVEFAGIGRVDFVVDGWLVIECDSEEFHGGWEAQERDRLRDALLAARGYTTLRLTAKVIMHQPEIALAAVRGLLESCRGPAAR
jgi:hypothetical protein